jgi:hypothetical protein
MESLDNKTPNKPASGRPSLLGSATGAAPDKTAQTRMLASLERAGPIPGAVSKRRGNARRRYGIAALAVLLLAGAGAFFAFEPFDDAAASVAAANTPSRVSSVTPAEHAVPAAVAASVASADGAARIEPAAPVPAAAASTAVAQAAPAADPLAKLALADAAPAPAPAPVVHAAVATAGKEAAHARPHAQAAAATHPAAAHVAPKAHKPEVDADTELVAAIIARLDKRGAQPGAAAPAAVSEPTPASIAGKVHQCSANSDLVEARQCRNRACDGHWGKVDACPAARAPSTSRDDGADDGRRG